METTYQGVKESEEKLALFLKPFLGRAETLRSALHYLTGLLNQVARKNTWQLAAATGLNSPYAFQHLLGRAPWESQDLINHLQMVGIKEKQGGILVIDQTAFPKKGNQSAGVARQYNRTTRKWENAQVGVFLSYTSRSQELLIDRALYIPPGWFGDSQRCKKAKLPENLVYRSKAELAQSMLLGAFSHGIKPAWVVGDQVYAEHELRT